MTTHITYARYSTAETGLKHHKEVISLIPVKWSFGDYVQGDNNPISDWHHSLSDEARFEFDALLKNCVKTENPIHWIGFRGFLKGKLKNERIWELGFTADKRQYRLLGIFGETRKTAVLLIGCYHKSRNYTPSDALDTAVKRAKALREGGADVHERKISTDF